MVLFLAENEDRRHHRSRRPAAAALVLLVVALLYFSNAFASSPPSVDYPPAHDRKQTANPAWPHEKSLLQPDPALVFGRLDNGFRYVLKENRRPENRVSLHLYIKAGSLNETDDQRGIAHFLEHMLFNGSTHFPPGELVRYFQSIGMQFGADANAYTGFNETVYDVRLPFGDEENLKKGLLVVGDYAMGALLLEEEVDRERGVILAEKRSRDSVEYRMFKRTLAFELQGFLAAQRMPIGTEAVIQKTDRQLLRRFYDAWYRPDNMVLVMVGDFRSPLAEALIKERFAEFEARAPAPPPPQLGTVNHQGIKAFHLHEPEAGGTTVSIEVLRDHRPVSDSPRLRRKELVQEIADRIVQNRLDSALKKQDAPFTAAQIGSGVYLNHIRYTEITADVADSRWRQTLSALEQTLRRAKTFGFDLSELSRVKKNVHKELEDAVRKAPTRDSRHLARRIIGDLSRDRVTQSPEQEQQLLAVMVESITLTEVHQAFQRNWPDQQRLLLVTGNTPVADQSPAPPEQSILEAYQASLAEAVKPPASKETVAFPYLERPALQRNIASRKHIDDLGITHIVLDNGIRVNVKPTDYKTDEVLVNLIFGHGKSAEPKSLPGISLLAEETLQESGLGAMQTDELKRALAGSSTYVDFRIEETHFAFFGETTRAEVELLFQLLYAHLVDPAIRENALALAKRRLRQEFSSFSRSIDGMMRIQGLRFLAGGDSRFGLPAFEKIEAIEAQDIRKWILPPLREAPLEFSLVGDVDETVVIDLARRYLGALDKRDQARKNPRMDRPTFPAGVVEHIAVDTQISKALVVSAWKTDDFWDIHRTRRLSALADLFADRLRERIREKLGASYSPFAFNRASRAYEGYGVFQAYVSADPQQIDIVLSEVRGIALDLATNGVSKEELKRILDPIVTSIKTLRQTNGYWLNSVLTGSYRHPQQLTWARHFIEDYERITAKEVSDLSAAYLTEERSAAVIIAPKR